MKFHKIHIDQANRAGKPTYYVASNVRLATATGVVFVGNDQLVVTHLVGQSMHLLEYNSENYCTSQIAGIDTVFGGQLTITDLIDYDGHEHLLTSNFDDCSGSLYKIINSKLSYIKDLPLPEGSGNCHGARFYDKNIACLTTNSNKLFFMDIPSSTIIAEFDMPYHLKDICFFDSNCAVAPFALSSPTPSIASSYASGLLYFSLDLTKLKLELIHKTFLSPCAFDAICVDRQTGRLYITDQHGDRLIIAEVSHGKIQIIGEITGFDFPHGIDINGRHMAVTNYGDSSVSVVEIGDVRVSSFTGTLARRKPYRKADVKKLLRYYISRIRQYAIGKR